jgi:hypothetical protein
MELPISLFYGSIAFFLSLPVFGYIFRMQIPVSAFFFLSGGLMIAFLLAVDTLQIPEDPQQRITTYNSTTIVENKIPFDFSLEGENYQLKVFWILISVFLLVGGVLIEVKGIGK